MSLGLIIVVFRRLNSSKKSILQPDLSLVPYPFVTIQIPTYNELAVLNCVQHCLAFDYPKDRYDILIGDDSDNPDISQTIDSFAALYPQVQVCRRGNNEGYKPANLNHMLAFTQGEYILVFDSDFRPESDFLKKIVQPLRINPTLSGIQARWQPLYNYDNFVTLLGASVIDILCVVLLGLFKDFAHSSILLGSAFLIRKDELLESQQWQGVMAEDLDYSLRLLSQGHSMLYLEELGCDCEVPHTLKDLFRQQRRWAYGISRVLFNYAPTFLFSPQINWRIKLCTGYLIILTVLSPLVLSLTLVLGLLTDTTALLVAIEHPSSPVTGMRGLFTFLFVMVSLTVEALVFIEASLSSKRGLLALSRSLLTFFSLGLILPTSITLGITKASFNQSLSWIPPQKLGNFQIKT